MIHAQARGTIGTQLFSSYLTRRRLNLFAHEWALSTTRPLSLMCLMLGQGSNELTLLFALASHEAGLRTLLLDLDGTASGALSVRTEEDFVRSLGLYRKAEGDRVWGSIPNDLRSLARPPLVFEVFKSLGRRMSWPNPDEYGAFLSSLYATSGEPIGTRINDAGTSSQQMVTVMSQSSAPVELTRAQLRAVVRVYGRQLAGREP